MQFSIQNSLISNRFPLRNRHKHFGYPGRFADWFPPTGIRNGIVWILETDKFGVNGNAVVLRAFDAANVSRELYDTSQNSARDAAGPAVKFTAPDGGQWESVCGHADGVKCLWAAAVSVLVPST
jgi:hypothetical protein